MKSITALLLRESFLRNLARIRGIKYEMVDRNMVRIYYPKECFLWIMVRSEKCKQGKFFWNLTINILDSLDKQTKDYVAILLAGPAEGKGFFLTRKEIMRNRSTWEDTGYESGGAYKIVNKEYCLGRKEPDFKTMDKFEDLLITYLNNGEVGGEEHPVVRPPLQKYTAILKMLPPDVQVALSRKSPEEVEEIFRKAFLEAGLLGG